MLTEKVLQLPCNTNTLLKIMSVYGIPYIMILVYCLYRFFKKYNSSFVALGLLAIFSIILSNEDLIVNIVPYVLAFYGLKSNSKQQYCNSMIDEL